MFEAALAARSVLAPARREHVITTLEASSTPSVLAGRRQSSDRIGGQLRRSDGYGGNSVALLGSTRPDRGGSILVRCRRRPPTTTDSVVNSWAAAWLRPNQCAHDTPDQWRSNGRQLRRGAQSMGYVRCAVDFRAQVRRAYPPGAEGNSLCAGNATLRTTHRVGTRRVVAATACMSSVGERRP